jgi:hypothetical protein
MSDTCAATGALPLPMTADWQKRALNKQCSNNAKVQTTSKQ